MDLLPYFVDLELELGILLLLFQVLLLHRVVAAVEFIDFSLELHLVLLELFHAALPVILVIRGPALLQLVRLFCSLMRAFLSV